MIKSVHPYDHGNNHVSFQDQYSSKQLHKSTDHSSRYVTGVRTNCSHIKMTLDMSK